MINLLWSNQYVKLVIGLLVGIGVGYLLLPEKVKIKEVKVVEYVKTKAKIVKVEKQGITVTTTDFSTDSQTQADIFEQEKTNYKDSFVFGSFTIYNKAYSYNANFGHFITNNLGVFVGISYYHNSLYLDAKSVGGTAGVILKF
jgi:hypothetical protein